MWGPSSKPKCLLRLLSTSPPSQAPPVSTRRTPSHNRVRAAPVAASSSHGSWASRCGSVASPLGSRSAWPHSNLIRCATGFTTAEQGGASLAFTLLRKAPCTSGNRDPCSSSPIRADLVRGSTTTARGELQHTRQLPPATHTATWTRVPVPIPALQPSCAPPGAAPPTQSGAKIRWGWPDRAVPRWIRWVEDQTTTVAARAPGAAARGPAAAVAPAARGAAWRCRHRGGVARQLRHGGRGGVARRLRRGEHGPVGRWLHHGQCWSVARWLRPPRGRGPAAPARQSQA